MRVSVAVSTELHPTRKIVMAVMILPACTVRVYIYIRSIYLMRRMSVAGFRSNSRASVLQTSPRHAEKAKSYQSRRSEELIIIIVRLLKVGESKRRLSFFY
jgi:hypothetical protein